MGENKGNGDMKKLCYQRGTMKKVTLIYLYVTTNLWALKKK